MNRTFSYSENNFEMVYLVGVKLWPDSHQPDLYTLVLYNEVARNDENRPLTHDGQILFFRTPRDANRALSLGDAAFRKYNPIGEELAYVYDIPKVLALVAGADRDEPGIVADFINELLDFVTATRWALPPLYRDSLFALADRTTFDKDLTGLYDRAPNLRSEASNALLWCLGAVLSTGRLLS
jgi:hypothetical protein